VIALTAARTISKLRVDDDRLVGNTAYVKNARSPRRAALATTVAVALAAVLGLAACTKSASPKPSAQSPVAETAPASPTPTTTFTQPPPPAQPTLKMGAKGEPVLRLQQQLNSLGYWTNHIDGKFDFTTQQAVFALQKAANLKVNGTVGASTWAALGHLVRPTARSTSGTLIEVDLSRDLLMFIKDGQVQYTLNTSTGGGYKFIQEGKQEVAITPKGHFKTYRVIDELHKSPLGLMLRPRYFFEGFAIHGDGSVPSYPASHGCVRVSNPAIDWIWAQNLDPVGMTVWIYS